MTDAPLGAEQLTAAICQIAAGDTKALDATLAQIIVRAQASDNPISVAEARRLVIEALRAVEGA